MVENLITLSKVKKKNVFNNNKLRKVNIIYKKYFL